MKIRQFRLQNFRSFVDSGFMDLDQVNVLIGRNNSGKSSILRGLHQIQLGLGDPYADIRSGQKQASIEMTLSDASGRGTSWEGFGAGFEGQFIAQLQSDDHRSGVVRCSLSRGSSATASGEARFPNAEPNHFIVPFFSKRKTAAYSSDAGEQQANTISSDMTFMAAKLVRIGNPAFPKHEAYARACREILGFVVAAIPSANGLRPGVYLPDASPVWIDQMGDGVPNVVQLLINLASYENKLFLLEEPENDLHPSALKSLLDLVLLSANSNQFVISTHSNIVVRHLCGGENSKLFRISADHGVLPAVARVECVQPTPDARISALEDLGYSLADFELWDGWLILEESSAERIIRDYLIPWFTPSLKRIRTIAAGGVDKVTPLLEDLMRLILYAHLTPIYAGRTWVRVDGDTRGASLVEKLHRDFPSWPKDRIGLFSNSRFEKYYPKDFEAEISHIDKLPDRQEQRKAKKALLESVRAWLDADEERGRAALEQSAREVIDVLLRIQDELKRTERA